MKKLLYLSDLYNYYVTQNKNVKFSSADNDTTIVVHIDEPFTYDQSEDDDLNMYCPIRLCHTEKNANQSFISEKAMENALPSAYNMPILGYIYNNGEKDVFASHELYVNDDGETVYEEIPVGCIPESADLKLVYDVDMDKTYVDGTGIIWKTYSKAAEIIEREKRLSVSVELFVDELSYDSKEKVLCIDKFRFSGVTILEENRYPGEEVKPGMVGSNISIADFSVENNSVFSQNEKVIKLLSELNEKIDGLNINQEISKEGGTEDVEKEFEEITEEVTEEITEEEIKDSPSEEVFEDEPKKKKDPDDGAIIPDGDDSDSDDDDDKEEPKDDEESEDTEEPEEVDDAENSDDVDYYSVDYTINVNGIKKEFSISLKEKLNALTTLINETYGEVDGAWYDVDVIEDTKTVEFHDWWMNKHYRQSYAVKKDVYSLKGDRVETFVSFLTSDEKAQLDQMKANYSSIEEKLQQYESEPDKIKILESDEYAQIKDTDAYKKLAERDTYFSMSEEELVEQLDKALLDFAKHNKIEFSSNEDEAEKKTISAKIFTNPAKKISKRSKYGGLGKNKDKE